MWKEGLTGGLRRRRLGRLKADLSPIYYWHIFSCWSCFYLSLRAGNIGDTKHRAIMHVISAGSQTWWGRSNAPLIA